MYKRQAWIIQEGESAGNIKEIDFETLETRSLAPSSGQSLVLNGFMNEDLVYGIVVDGDVIADDNGHETTGIHTVRIEGFDGTLKKEYHQDGLYAVSYTHLIMHVKAAVEGKLQEVQFISQNLETVIIMTKIAAA